MIWLAANTIVRALLFKQHYTSSSTVLLNINTNVIQSVVANDSCAIIQYSSRTSTVTLLLYNSFYKEEIYIK